MDIFGRATKLIITACNTTFDIFLGAVGLRPMSILFCSLCMVQSNPLCECIIHCIPLLNVSRFKTTHSLPVPSQNKYQIQAQKFCLANFSNWQQMGLLLMFGKFSHNNIIKYSDKYKASKENIPLYYSKEKKKRDSFILQSDLNYEKIQIMRCHTVFI